MTKFTKYKRTNVAEMTPWTPDIDMTWVSVSEADRKNGSPKEGDMIARNPANFDDKWLVEKAYFQGNFVEYDDCHFETVWPFYEYNGTDTIHEEYAIAILLQNDVLFQVTRQYLNYDWNKVWEGKDSALEGRLGSETIVLFVLCNDVFGPGADGEPITCDEVKDLFVRWYNDKVWGVAKWVAIRRKQRPQESVIGAMKASGSWCDEMEALPKPVMP